MVGQAATLRVSGCNCMRDYSLCVRPPKPKPMPMPMSMFHVVCVCVCVRGCSPTCPSSQDRFGEHSSVLDSITHALVELSTPESSLNDGELSLHSRPAEMLEMLDHIRRHLHTREHEDLWREFCEYVPTSWTSRDYVHTVVPASWAPPAGSCSR